MIKNKKFTYGNIKLLIAVCLFSVVNLSAQSILPLGKAIDSINPIRDFSVVAMNNLKKFSKQDSLLSFRKIRIRTIVIAETHYYGLVYENTNLPKWTTTCQISNKIELAGIPLQLDAFLGDKVALPGRGISRVNLKFDANTFLQNLAKKALEDRQKKLITELQNDSNFKKYKTALQTVETYQNLFSQRSYLTQIQNQKNLVKQYESIGDSIILKKPIYKDTKKNVEQYEKTLKELDSLKKYLVYADKINPMWKSFKDSSANLSKNVNLYDRDQCMKQLENNKLIPAPLRWLSHIQKLEVGMVFPDFQPLIFKGAPLKGFIVSAQRRTTFADVTFGKLYSPGDFFRDTLISSKVYALAFRTGVAYKKIRISYSFLQTHRINTSDTFAFRYYFESPKETTVQGLSFEWSNKIHKLFLHTANSTSGSSHANTNNETPRSNDINKLLPGSHPPISAKSAMQLGYTFSINKTKSEITLKYNYQGQYYFSPMRVFTQPPGSQYEAIFKQSFYKKQVQFKVGATRLQSKYSSGFFSYNDKTYSYNFQISVNLKKLPSISVSYLPYYRTSLYQNQEVLLKMEQLTATSLYSRQKKNNFVSIVGSYNRNKVENIYSGVFEQAVLYSTYKNLRSPLGYNLINTYFKQPTVSKDSAVTYDIKGAVEYQVMPQFIIHLGGGYAINKERSRYYPYFDLSWNNLYLGQIKLRADYTWLNEYGIYNKQGMNFSATITRAIF